MRPANKLRGEVFLTLDSTDFVLRPSYEALLAIEEKTGKTILALYNAATEADIGLRDTAITVTELIRAWGRATDDPVAKNVDLDRVGQLIQGESLMGVALKLTVVLGLAITGGYEPDGTRKDVQDDEGD